MKIAIITGASAGMGREFVNAIDREYTLDALWVIARRADRLEALRQSCRTPVKPLALDLSAPESWETLRSLLASEQPEIELVVNAAGYGLFGAFADMGMEEQLGMVDLNDRALTAVCHLCLPYLHRGSSIVNLASNASWQPVPYMNVYAASKAYVLSLTRALGRELKPKGVHTMAVCPFWVQTEFFDRAVRDDTITYYNHIYKPEEIVARAMKDLKKRRKVSICGLQVKAQVLAVKLLPMDFVMNTWCRQQKKP